MTAGRDATNCWRLFEQNHSGMLGISLCVSSAWLHIICIECANVQATSAAEGVLVWHAHAVPIQRSVTLRHSGPVVEARVWYAEPQPRQSCNSRAEMWWKQAQVVLLPRHRRVNEFGVDDVDDRITSQLLWRRAVSLTAQSRRVRRDYARRLTVGLYRNQLEENSLDHAVSSGLHVIVTSVFVVRIRCSVLLPLRIQRCRGGHLQVWSVFLCVLHRL